MKRLPVDAVVPQVVASERGAVLVAPPGSGKTTRVPPALVEALPGRVLLLQPRRVAARMAARRIAQERGWRIGEEIGWRIRFEDTTGPSTRLEVLTEGVLTRRLQVDPFLEGVSAVVLDEFHERSLHADLALALLADAGHRVVVMSATLDPAPVGRFLDVPVFRARGRTYPVQLSHHVGDLAEIVRQRRASDGHTLVFLDGLRSIRRLAAALADLSPLPLHGSLPAAEQDRALAPSPRPKLVLATNIAETSVTLEGVRVVIDTGWAKVPRFDPAVGLERLERVRISEASADQRAGRAGRTGPGRCVRVWPSTERLRPHEAPEIQRADLCDVLLQLRQWGVEPADFRWFEAPPEASLQSAARLLEQLDEHELLARLPVHPRLGAVIAAAHRRGWLEEASLAAALLTERDPFRRDGGALQRTGDDLLDRVRAIQAGRGERGAARQVRRVAGQLSRIARRELGRSRSAGGLRALGPVLRAGYPDRVGVARAPGSDRYLLASGTGAIRGRHSRCRAHLLVAVDLAAATPEHEIRLASPLPLEEVELERRRVVGWREGGARSWEERRLGELVVEELPSAEPPNAEEAARLLRQHVGPENLSIDEDLLARLAYVARARPELPTVDLEGVLDELCVGRRTVEALRTVDASPLVRARLTWRLRQALEELAPRAIRLPSGSRRRIDYRGEQPVLRARIQQLFGWEQVPPVGGQAVRIHLLGPHNRPVQITDDLAGFWDGSYAEVRKELRGRYPKHAWPEDPRTGQPEDRPRRRR